MAEEEASRWSENSGEGWGSLHRTGDGYFRELELGKGAAARIAE